MEEVELTYFKPSGKYYSGGKLRVENLSFYQFVDHVVWLRKNGTLPGLMESTTGHGYFAVHFVYQDIPHIVPSESKAS